MHYFEHLNQDAKLATLISGHAGFNLFPKKDICFYLCNSIMSQQLSVKVADVFHKRFLALYGNKKPSAQQIVDTPFETLRNIGLSNAKANYIKNVAEFELAFGMNVKKLNKMSDDEIIDYLTQIKGVGRWTVEMLLMFALGREDVFPADDLGIQQAMQKVYGIKNSDKKLMLKKMKKIAANWAPYRTYACLHLWHHKDSK